MSVVTAASQRNGRQADDPGFHQSWFPVGLAAELGEGAVIGRDFLGTRVVLYRGPAGQAVVQSAWCPHLGADLSVGQIVEGRLRCAYHHWSFDEAGRCADIPSGDKIPPGAGIFTYPSAEAWGLIWAFNGREPLFGLPRLPNAEQDDLLFEAHRRGERALEPWVAVSNGVDFQHLRTLHGLPQVAVPETIEVEDYAVAYSVAAPGFAQHGRITGTNTFAQHIRLGDDDMFMLFSGAPVGQGRSMGYYVFGVPKPSAMTSAAEAAQRAKLAALRAWVDKLYEEDAAVLNTIRFRRGTLTASDRHLARYLKYVDQFPLAAPPEA